MAQWKPLVIGRLIQWAHAQMYATLAGFHGVLDLHLHTRNVRHLRYLQAQDKNTLVILSLIYLLLRRTRF